MGNLHLRFDEGRVGRATCAVLSYSTLELHAIVWSRQNIIGAAMKRIVTGIAAMLSLQP